VERPAWRLTRESPVVECRTHDVVEMAGPSEAVTHPAAIAVHDPVAIIVESGNGSVLG